MNGDFCYEMIRTGHTRIKDKKKKSICLHIYFYPLILSNLVNEYAQFTYVYSYNYKHKTVCTSITWPRNIRKSEAAAR